MKLKTVDIYSKDHPQRKVTINESDLEKTDVLWTDHEKSLKKEPTKPKVKPKDK